LNDLWKFDGNSWTWICGNDEVEELFRRGVVRVESNMPSSRANALGWTDLNDNFWLFGGMGLSKTKGYSDMNFV
jgi:hypothetical protein